MNPTQAICVSGIRTLLGILLAIACLGSISLDTRAATAAASTASKEAPEGTQGPVDDLQWASGIPAGSPFPAISAPDQEGQTWTNQGLIGEHGLVFFFVRSSDW